MSSNKVETGEIKEYSLIWVKEFITNDYMYMHVCIYECLEDVR
jgi:hypothetical protein